MGEVNNGEPRLDSQLVFLDRRETVDELDTLAEELEVKRSAVLRETTAIGVRVLRGLVAAGNVTPARPVVSGDDINAAVASIRRRKSGHSAKS